MAKPQAQDDKQFQGPAIKRALASHQALLSSIQDHCSKSVETLTKEWEALDNVEKALPKDNLQERPDLVKKVKLLQARKMEIQRTVGVLNEASDGCLVKRTDDQVFNKPEGQTRLSDEPEEGGNEVTLSLGREPLHEWVGSKLHPHEIGTLMGNAKEFGSFHDQRDWNPSSRSGHGSPLYSANQKWTSKQPDGNYFIKSAATHNQPDHHIEELTPKLAHHYGLQDYFDPVKVHEKLPGDKFHKVSSKFMQGQSMMQMDPKDRVDAVSKIPPHDRLKLLMFDFLSGNNDRHHGNVFVENGQTKMIDHGLAMQKESWGIGHDVGHPLIDNAPRHALNHIDGDLIEDMLHDPHGARNLITEHLAKGNDHLSTGERLNGFNDRLAFLKELKKKYAGDAVSLKDFDREWEDWNAAKKETKGQKGHVAASLTEAMLQEVIEL